LTLARRDQAELYGELNVLDDILTEAPDQDDELYNPESEHHVNQKKGSKRKNDRGDNHVLKRLRPSAHTATRQATKRPAPSAGASGKKPVNPRRGRHPSEYSTEDYYEDRKTHAMRDGGAPRWEPPKAAHPDKPLGRRREPDRHRIKPELTTEKSTREKRLATPGKSSEKTREKLSSSVRAVRKNQTSKLKYVVRDARFFMIKSNNHENGSSTLLGRLSTKCWNIAPEWRSGLWHRISVQEASLQSLVRIRAVSHPDVIGSPIGRRTISPSCLAGVGLQNVIVCCSVKFSLRWGLGQTINWCGMQLCMLFPQDESINLYQVIHKMRHKRRIPYEPRSRGRPPHREAARGDLGRGRPEENAIHNRKRPRLDYPAEFPQRPGYYYYHMFGTV
uniref:Uncharacterized protein n=1 Tax=Hucho hucho TaxID=62062 RepID=A0A4W5P4W3_9TELE